MRIHFLTSLAFLVCAASYGSEPLTWDALVAEASERNADLLTAKEAMHKAEANVRVAWGPFLPQLTGTLSYSHGNASSASGNVPGSSGGGSSTGTVFGVVTTTDQYSMAINATQNLFNGFQDKAKLNQARASLASASASFRGQKATVHQSLKKAFAQLLYTQQSVDLSVKIEKRRKDNYDLVSLRFEGGRENKGSFLKSRAQLRQAHFDVSQGRRNYEVAQQTMASLLGRAEYIDIRVTGELKTKAVPVSLPQTRGLAKTTPSVEQSAADLQVAQAGVAGAAGALLPSIGLTGSVSKVGLTFPPETNRWAVGVSVSIPIFRYGDWEGISSAKAEERRAEHNFHSADRQAAALLASTLTKFQIATEKVDVQTEVRDASEARSEIARAQYTSGLIAYSEWDIIETDRITQAQSLLASKLDAVNTEADWDKALGQGDIR